MAADIAILKVKAGILGLVGGIIPLAIMIVLWLVKMNQGQWSTAEQDCSILSTLGKER